MPLSRDKEAIGIFGIDDDGCNLLRVAQSEMLPGTTRVGRFVDAVAYGEIGAAQAFAAADVDRVRIRRCDCQGADRPGGLIVVWLDAVWLGVVWLIIENRIPRTTEVRRLPDSAVVRRHVEDVRLPRNA